MIRIDRTIVVAQVPEVLFELLSEPLRFLALFPAVSRVELVSERGRSSGARYLVLIRVGRMDAGGVQRITEFCPPRRMAFASETGIQLSGAVSITPIDASRTEVRLAFEYEVPGLRAPAVLVELMTRHIVDRHVQATLLSIKRLAEFDLDWMTPRNAGRPTDLLRPSATDPRPRDMLRG